MTTLSEAPEVCVTCAQCDGEGSIDVWKSVSKWSIDPPSAHPVPCEACGGAGSHICEAEGDQE